VRRNETVAVTDDAVLRGTSRLSESNRRPTHYESPPGRVGR
jgi:hypothetical protein